MVKQGRWKMWCSKEVMNCGGLLPGPEGCGYPEGSGWGGNGGSGRVGKVPIKNSVLVLPLLT